MFTRAASRCSKRCTPLCLSRGHVRPTHPRSSTNFLNAGVSSRRGPLPVRAPLRTVYGLQCQAKWILFFSPSADLQSQAHHNERTSAATVYSSCC
jgi:hypothetical protein